MFIQVVNEIKCMESITKLLRSDSTDMSDVRNPFDEIILKYLGLKECLVPDVAIVHSPIFESAIVKIQEIKQETPNFEEQRAVDFLKNEISDENDFSKVPKKGYMDSRFLLPTSNMVEIFQLGRLYF